MVIQILLHAFGVHLYLDCSTYIVGVLTFQIEHKMSIHAVDKQMEGTGLPIADVSSSMVEEVYSFGQTEEIFTGWGD